MKTQSKGNLAHLKALTTTPFSDKVRVVDKKDKYMTLTIIKAYTLQTN